MRMWQKDENVQHTRINVRGISVPPWISTTQSPLQKQSDTIDTNELDKVKLLKKKQILPLFKKKHHMIDKNKIDISF